MITPDIIENAIKENNTEYILECMRDEDFSFTRKENIVRTCIMHDNFSLFKLCMNILDKGAITDALDGNNRISLFQSILIPILNRDYVEYIQWVYNEYQTEKLLTHILNYSTTYLCMQCLQYACETIRPEEFRRQSSTFTRTIIEKGHLPLLKIVFQHITIDEWNAHTFLGHAITSPSISKEILNYFIERGCLQFITSIDCERFFSALLTKQRLDIFKHLIAHRLPIHPDFIIECINKENIEWFNYIFPRLDPNMQTDNPYNVDIVQSISIGGKFMFYKEYIAQRFNGDVEGFISWCKQRTIWNGMIMCLSKWVHLINLEDDLWWRMFWFSIDKVCELNRGTSRFKERIRNKQEEIRLLSQYTQKEYKCIEKDVITYCINEYF